MEWCLLGTGLVGDRVQTHGHIILLSAVSLSDTQGKPNALHWAVKYGVAWWLLITAWGFPPLQYMLRIALRVHDAVVEALRFIGRVTSTDAWTASLPWLTVSYSEEDQLPVANNQDWLHVKDHGAARNKTRKHPASMNLNDGTATLRSFQIPQAN